jgi:hypothetical protein
MIAADPLSRLSRPEYVMLEIATVGFMFCAANLKEEWVDRGNAPFEILSQPSVFSIVVVTIPGILVWQVLFFLFTCPVCLVDSSTSSKEVKSRAKKFTRAGEIIGYLVMVIGAVADAMLLHQSLVEGVGETNLIDTVAHSRLQGYVISWLLMLFLYFNPVLAWGQPDPAGGFCLGDYIGIGQWRIEKQRFQHLCVKAFDTWLRRNEKNIRSSFSSHRMSRAKTQYDRRQNEFTDGASVLLPVNVEQDDDFLDENFLDVDMTCCVREPVETVSFPRSAGSSKQHPLRPVAADAQAGDQNGLLDFSEFHKTKDLSRTCGAQCSLGEELFGP